MFSSAWQIQAPLLLTILSSALAHPPSPRHNCKMEHLPMEDTITLVAETENEFAQRALLSIPSQQVNEMFVADVTTEPLSEQQVRAVAHQPAFNERTTVRSCNASQSLALRSAIQSVVQYAADAADAVERGPDKIFLKYFHTLEVASKRIVAARLRAISQEASVQNGSETVYSCTEHNQGTCAGGMVAYHLGFGNAMYNCPQFYQLPTTPRFCGDDSQIATVLHEMTHVEAIFRPPTTDISYSWAPEFQNLTGPQAVLNADSYVAYADAVALGCD